MTRSSGAPSAPMAAYRLRPTSRSALGHQTRMTPATLLTVEITPGCLFLAASLIPCGRTTPTAPGPTRTASCEGWTSTQPRFLSRVDPEAEVKPRGARIAARAKPPCLGLQDAKSRLESRVAPSRRSLLFDRLGRAEP